MAGLSAAVTDAWRGKAAAALAHAKTALAARTEAVVTVRDCREMA